MMCLSLGSLSFSDIYNEEMAADGKNLVQIGKHYSSFPRSSLLFLERKQRARELQEDGVQMRDYSSKYFIDNPSNSNF
jgi:hypothetical protein